MKRLFIGIPLSLPMRRAFYNSQNRTVAGGVKWVPPENLHITVCFVGEVPDDQVIFIQQNIASVCLSFSKFSLEFDEIIFAPPFRRPPNMIWAKFYLNKQFSRLVADIHRALNIALDKEQIPHVTLARLKDPGAGARIKIKQPELVSSILDVDQLVLVESQLSKEGPQYSVIEWYSL